MPARNFRTAVAYRLGLPMLSEEIPCPLCEQPINIYGDHATCCTKSGDLIMRHNSIRNLVNSIASDALLSPVLEKKGILGDTNGRRPGDVTFQKCSAGKGLAIPLAMSQVRTINPCEEYAATVKHHKYDKSFEGTEYVFSAMVFETLGAVNWEGEEVYASYFASQPSAWERSLLPIVVVPGLAFLVTCNGPFRRLFSLVQMDKLSRQWEFKLFFLCS